MKSVERQQQILGILYQKGHETIKNLSDILNVSERTIRRDIEFLSLSEPIYTKAGRYAGGIYIANKDSQKIHRLKYEKVLVLQKISQYIKETHFLSEEEFKLFDSILKTYESKR